MAVSRVTVHVVVADGCEVSRVTVHVVVAGGCVTSDGTCSISWWL